jgi:hypothetical protein
MLVSLEDSRATRTKGLSRPSGGQGMKMVSVLVGLMLLLTACAAPQLVTRDQFMKRGEAFDNRHLGEEYTEKYRTCYGPYFNYLFKNCKPKIDGGLNLYYWTCADKALDAFEDCMGDERT